MSIYNIDTSKLKNYESHLQADRLQFGDELAVLFSESNPKTLLMFWINFCSYGVGMTEPVEHWIKRAGENCQLQGFHQLGEKLCKHAVHEADHQLLMIEDTKMLVKKWNEIYHDNLDWQFILNRSLPKSVLGYQTLHEDYINSTQPYCQIAIEYEIENLSVIYGPQILNQTLNILGKDIISCLSFLDEHLRIDVAHTQYNKKAISEFIASFPETENNLIIAGKKALKQYREFINSCYPIQ